MSQLKNIMLCADDFGLNKGVSLGILKLVRMNRLSAVSCMVNVQDFALYARELLDRHNQVRTGLHFNLTEGSFLSKPERTCFRLNELILRTHMRTINKAQVVKELNAQLEHYIEVMGEYPEFIDGHQHVHQFPVIRQAIIDLYKQRSLKDKGVFIRSTYPALTLPQFKVKSAILARTGGKKFNAQLKQLNILHNSCFSGVYDFAPDSDYRSLFRQWLARVPSNALIMCHPGEGDDPADVISSTRKQEMNYFMSDEFLFDCEELQISLNLTTSPES
ncbi:ChbG/HpnK family deacetylase [Legionella quateirensis]|uniref:Cellobiose phosphorylase n=1 Tax=Legionella quateirensis TaxID=45072 RepID=A0A378KWR2_9GAMM|nr:ChbG/HpnK family deacetylase [Legionella quateirensis]KTD46216.1 cellobiose phosphorylase [Legionella quateirensis]STY19015.1 cellobiose phosphorylase [Legionella quateirensis]